MQAYKAKGKIDATGNLVVTQPIEIPPGNVEVIILQVADEVNSTETATESQTETSKNQVRYRTNAFRDLLENSPSVPPDFDPESAKWEYLKEKHNL
ncbi:hypothetical protein Riv7116_3001 [Rivularia sp. PCC 7116]|uniref:hypothetical protein n=1 Tax=Rivularia sp. PCC 7116 TaxID=373994 RepID=UPI00029F1FC7|nr:hypothetical protein [Rivularia sp. PCC 7116]AFY55482.1 hypothetical protein Riv7116_3001 [Rivularia sp. PCC 7116]